MTGGLLALVGGTAVAGWVLTAVARRYALTRAILDRPNERSSHGEPTPLGGGWGIVVPAIGAMSLAYTLGWIDGATLIGLGVGGGAVALVGWIDDRVGVSAWVRLLVQGAAAWWLMKYIGATSMPLGAWGTVVAVLGVVWCTNLYNFMDGIDGIAGVETVTVSLGGALLYVVAAPGNPQWIPPVILASATLGFLVWNWAPAKIFMGDAGSGFLGLMLAGFSLSAARVTPALLWGWIILLGVFVGDATVTLVRRMVQGDRFYEAHRDHAYQHAARRWGAHRPVTVAVGLINVGWLFPIGLLVALGYLGALAGVLLAYAPIVAATLWLRAGQRDGDDAHSHPIAEEP